MDGYSPNYGYSPNSKPLRKSYSDKFVLQIENEIQHQRKQSDFFRLSFSIPNISTIDTPSPKKPTVDSSLLLNGGEEVSPLDPTYLNGEFIFSDNDSNGSLNSQSDQHQPVDISEDDVEKPLLNVINNETLYTSNPFETISSDEDDSENDDVDKQQCLSDIQMCTILPDSPFKLFKENELCESSTFTPTFSSRECDYYGDVGYSYTGVMHSPKPFDQNPYLLHIISYLKIVLPDFRFNSALIQRYMDGSSHIPSHSDDEESIVEDSNIVTISLGSSRHISFVSKSAGENISADYLLQHGDVMVMSRKSQNHFKHSIPVEDGVMGPRTSVTFRLLHQKPYANKSTPPAPSTQGVEKTSNIPPSYFHHTAFQTAGSKPMNSEMGKHTVLISSSMFRNINTGKLSSDGHKFTKFFYPGADSSRMRQKLSSDPDFSKLEKSTVNNVVLLTGSNNVDGVYKGHPGASLSRAKTDITAMVNFVRKSFPLAVVRVLNILPRATKGRNDVINALNKSTEEMCNNVTKLQYLDTQQNCMFSHCDGTRRNEFFKGNRGRFDDVHLNNNGVVRLGKFIKFLSYS